MKNILIINICKNPLHYFEFVKPIEDILQRLDHTFETIPYNELSSKVSKHIREYQNNFDKIIISGTSLQDNDYLNHIDNFIFLKDFDKPILGICGGMQIIAKIHDAKITPGLEIGMTIVEFDNFLGIDGRHEVYAMHNLQTSCPEGFVIKAKNPENKYIHAIQHSKKPIFGVLFHPEVRSHKIIETFLYSY